jgi:hypothetical protein
MAVGHGGNISSAMAWCGAALGAGALLGFLFGIPGRSSRRIIINQPGFAAVDSGINRALGNSGVTTTTDPTSGALSPPAPEVGANNAAGPGAGGADAVTPAASPNPPSQAGNEPLSEDSNLVQVSDWVTKLLLGGGLTQLQQIPSKIWELAGWVAIGIDPSVAVPGKEAILRSNQAFAAGLLTYFSILGFFAGYFITQLQFRKRLQP